MILVSSSETIDRQPEITPGCSDEFLQPCDDIDGLYRQDHVSDVEETVGYLSFKYHSLKSVVPPYGNQKLRIVVPADNT